MSLAPASNAVGSVMPFSPVLVAFVFRIAGRRRSLMIIAPASNAVGTIMPFSPVPVAFVFRIAGRRRSLKFLAPATDAVGTVMPFSTMGVALVFRVVVVVRLRGRRFSALAGLNHFAREPPLSAVLTASLKSGRIGGHASPCLVVPDGARPAEAGRVTGVVEVAGSVGRRESRKHHKHSEGGHGK